MHDAFPDTHMGLGYILPRFREQTHHTITSFVPKLGGMATRANHSIITVFPCIFVPSFIQLFPTRYILWAPAVKLGQQQKKLSKILKYLILKFISGDFILFKPLQSHK